MAEEALDARVIGGLVAANPELAARLLETKIKTRERRQLSCVAALLAAVCVLVYYTVPTRRVPPTLGISPGPHARTAPRTDRKNLRTEGFYGSGLYFEDLVSLKSEHRGGPVGWRGGGMAGRCLEWRGGVEFAAGVVVGRGWYRVCGGRGGRGMCGGGGGHGGRVCLDG